MVNFKTSIVHSFGPMGFYIIDKVLIMHLRKDEKR